MKHIHKFQALTNFKSICVCVHVIHAIRSRCAWKPGVDFRYVPSLLPSLFFKTGSHWAWGSSVKLTWPASPRVPPVCAPKAAAVAECSLTLSSWAQGVRAQVLSRLVWRSLTSHAISPPPFGSVLSWQHKLLQNQWIKAAGLSDTPERGHDLKSFAQLLL